MAAVVQVEGLSKSYGSRAAVVDLDFSVEQGEVFGYLGPNGAGKTTTIRLMLDLIRPTSGRVRILGLDVRHESVGGCRRRLGYLPGDAAPVRAHDRRAS